MKVKLFIRYLLCSIVFANTSYAIADTNKSRHSSQVIVFISFSMPDASVKQWMRQAEKIHAPVVIRGLINNSFKTTIQKMAELTKDNHGGVQIDPTLFRRFQINQLPAVVVLDEGDCLPGQSCFANYDVIYGDVTLDYALKKITDQHDALSPIAMLASKLLEGDKDE